MAIKPYYDRLLGRIRDDYGLGSSGPPGYDSPFFQSFSISGQVTPIEVGDSIPLNPTFLWSTVYPSNVKPNVISIDDVTAAVNIANSLPDTGSHAATYPAITKTAAGSNQFRIEGENTLGGLFYRMYVVDWQWRIYFGEDVNAGPLSEAQIEALRVGNLKANFPGAYVFLTGGYKYFCYPAVLGLASSFIDQGTGFPVAMQAPYTVSVTNAFGQTTNYNVRRTYNVLGGPITIVVS
jgi:hypothetical protein